MQDIPKQLIEISKRLKSGQIARYKARQVLKWFGAERRGMKIVADVRTALANLGLETDPPFEEASID